VPVVPFHFDHPGLRRRQALFGERVENRDEAQVPAQRGKRSDEIVDADAPALFTQDSDKEVEDDRARDLRPIRGSSCSRSRR
jgi:hypothetical protein